MRATLIVLWVCILSSLARAQVIYVDAGAVGQNDGASWADAFTDLQAALAIAGPGDAVWVAGGVYTPGPDGDPGQSFELRTGVGVYGGFAGNETALDQRDWLANQTTLSGDLGNDNARHVVVANGVDRTAVLDGFTITGGQASLPPDHCVDCLWGGGILNRDGSPTIVNCHVVDNESSIGAGMYNGPGAAPLLISTTFENNIPSGMYGYYTHVHMIGCRFVGNANTKGGGVQVSESVVVMEGCEFTDNLAWGDVGQTGGGGILATFSTLVLDSCLFHNNEADGGRAGAIRADSSEVTLRNCTIVDNDASFTTKGIYGSIGSSVTIENSILWGNGQTEAGQLGGDITSVTWSTIQGLAIYSGSPGNIGADPLFIDPAGGDYGLSAGSSAIDAGSNAASCTTTAFSSIPRRLDDPATPDTGEGIGPIVDMGAIEFVPPDCDDNGTADSIDIAGGAPDVNGNGIPDECEALEADCNGNGHVDHCEAAPATLITGTLVPLGSQAFQYATFENLPRAVSDVEIASQIRGMGAVGAQVRINGTPIGSLAAPPNRCFFSSPVALGLTAEQFNELVPTGDAVVQLATSFLDLVACPDPEMTFTLSYTGTRDCNDNGALDACDIIDGASTDCNDNGRPDDCEPQVDCNANRTVDVCEIGVDPALDLNHNAMLDGCEACTTLADCADGDGDGIRDDNCVWWACEAGGCVGTPVIFGDMAGQFGACPPDLTADASDRFAALACFSNEWIDEPCETAPPAAFNVDAGGPFGSCRPDGVCDGNDAFHALNAFSGESPCTCPLDAAGPSPSVGKRRGRSASRY